MGKKNLEMNRNPVETETPNVCPIITDPLIMDVSFELKTEVAV